MEDDTKILLTRIIELLEKIGENTENLSAVATEMESLKGELAEIRNRLD